MNVDDPYENRVNPGPDEIVPAEMAQERKDAMGAARGLVAAVGIACAFVIVAWAFYALFAAVAR